MNIQGEPAGRIVVELFGDAPDGAARFTQLASGRGGVDYRLSKFNGVLPVGAGQGVACGLGAQQGHMWGGWWGRGCRGGRWQGVCSDDDGGGSKGADRQRFKYEGQSGMGDGIDCEP